MDFFLLLHCFYFLFFLNKLLTPGKGDLVKEIKIKRYNLKIEIIFFLKCLIWNVILYAIWCFLGFQMNLCLFRVQCWSKTCSDPEQKGPVLHQEEVVFFFQWQEMLARIQVCPSLTFVPQCIFEFATPGLGAQSSREQPCSTDTVISTRGLSDNVGAEKTGLKKQKHSRLGLNGVLGPSFRLLTPSSPSLPKPHHHPGWRYLRQGHRPGDVRGARNALRLHRSHGNDAPQRTQW